MKNNKQSRQHRPPESVRVQDLFFVFYLEQQDTLLILKDFKNKVNKCLNAYIRWGNTHSVFLESKKKVDYFIKFANIRLKCLNKKTLLSTQCSSVCVSKEL